MKMNYVKNSNSKALPERFGITREKADEIKFRVLEASTTEQGVHEMLYGLVNKSDSLEEAIIASFWLGKLLERRNDMFSKIQEILCEEKPTDSN